MNERDYVNEGWSMDDCYPKEYPPCKLCNGPNDVAEICVKCAKENEAFGVDLEASGGWMVQDR